MCYADLELSLQRQSDDYAVELRLELADGSADAHLIAGAPPRLRLNAAALLDQTLDAAAYGQSLTRLLFADTRVSDAFARARDYARGAQAPLRLRLDADDAALHSLRWETLCDPAGDAFLCASENLLVTRYLDSADTTPLDLRPRADLKALVVVANPLELEQYKLAPVDVAGEVARSRAALEGIPKFADFVERLRPLLRAGALTLLVTSRRAPPFALLSEVEMLAGLRVADMRRMIESRGLALADELVDQLYLQTEGNAQLLTLAIDALQRTSTPAQLIGDLIDADDIVRYLMREVDESLSDDERAVMRAVAVLLDYGGTRGAIREVLDGASIRATLANAERAVGIASELGDSLCAGVGLRILAQALCAAGHDAEAMKAFRQSLELLDTRDAYEAARTRAQWGVCLATGADAARVAELLDQARATFAHLGAQRDRAASAAALAQTGLQKCV